MIGRLRRDVPWESVGYLTALETVIGSLSEPSTDLINDQRPFIWGCNGFDGDEEAGLAGGGAWPP